MVILAWLAAGALVSWLLLLLVIWLVERHGERDWWAR